VQLRRRRDAVVLRNTALVTAVRESESNAANVRPVAAGVVNAVNDRVDADHFAVLKHGLVRDVGKRVVRVGEEEVVHVDACVADADDLAAPVEAKRLERAIRAKSARLRIEDIRLAAVLDEA
jgi:hypothetical protein